MERREKIITPEEYEFEWQIVYFWEEIFQEAERLGWDGRIVAEYKSEYGSLWDSLLRQVHHDWQIGKIGLGAQELLLTHCYQTWGKPEDKRRPPAGLIYPGLEGKRIRSFVERKNRESGLLIERILENRSLASTREMGEKGLWNLLIYYLDWFFWKELRQVDQILVPFRRCHQGGQEDKRFTRKLNNLFLSLPFFVSWLREEDELNVEKKHCPRLIDKVVADLCRGYLGLLPQRQEEESNYQVWLRVMTDGEAGRSPFGEILAIFRGLDIDVNSDLFDLAYERVLSCLWASGEKKGALWTGKNKRKIKIPLASSVKILFTYAQNEGVGA